MKNANWRNIEGRKRTAPLQSLDRIRSTNQAKLDRPKPFIPNEEEKLYGNRFPSGFRKLKLLGKGGCAMVWLGEDELTGKKVAVKQVSRCSSSAAVESCQREIHFGKILNEVRHPATQSVAHLITSKSDRQDLWAIFEVGGSSLSKALFQLKGEFVKGERMYQVVHGPLYEEIKRNPEILKEFVKEMLEVLQLFSELNIVHSDLKPDNILVNEEYYDGVKLIDLGSAFSCIGNGSINTATPEYMPPEALELAHSPGDHIAMLHEISSPWSFDIWSLGMILLEIVSGVPLWMSLKSRVNRFGRLAICKGLLAASGRDPATILRMQHEVTRNLEQTVHKYAAFTVTRNFVDLLSRMLIWDPSSRISPEDALNHAYLN